MLRVLVTGGAGFIGSHLVDRLMDEGDEVTVLDNLGNGTLGNIRSWQGSGKFVFVRGDLKNRLVVEVNVDNFDLVFHFAANPEVRVGQTDPSTHLNENVLATFNLLEAMRKSKRAKTIVFASTSTVYGEASVIPTPEDYGPLTPISTYAASKLSCEALVSSYVYTFGLRGLILRLANIVGPRSNHGIVIDFVKKLRSDPNRLEILGDGSQKKSYLHVQDCVDAITCATRCFLENMHKVDIFNVGSADYVDVKRISEIIAEEMGIQNVAFAFTGGVDGGRGWFGDVKNMLLSVEKLSRLGWSPKYGSEEALRLAVKEAMKN